MAKYATIDVGTNSIKMHIAEQDERGAWNRILDTVKITRLGDGMHRTGLLSPEAIERNVAGIADFLKLAAQYQVEEIAAVGTMCLRTAQNAQDFVRLVEKECHLKLEVIPGEEEARLAYIAVESGLGVSQRNAVTIFDVGGGSTEFIFGHQERLEKQFSLNVGAVRYTEQLLTRNPVSPEQVAETQKAIEGELGDLTFAHAGETLVGIGGTVSNLCAVKEQLNEYEPDRIQGAKLSLEEVKRQIYLYQSKTIAERQEIVGLQPKRADVILAGALIVASIMTKTRHATLTVSDRGLRHGLMADRFDSALKEKKEPLNA